MKGYIYQIENLINHKSYIGQTLSIETRIKNHFLALKRNKHRNKKLQNAYNKYGEDNFSVKIWSFSIESREDLNKLECRYIDKFNSIEDGYNIAPGGGELPHIKKVKEQEVIIFLSILSIKGDGYGKTCEQIFSWSPGTSSSIKRKKIHLDILEKFNKLTYKEKVTIVNNAFEQYPIEQVHQKRLLKQGGELRAYTISKEEIYFAFYLQELGYSYNDVSIIIGMKPLTIKDWFLNRSRKKERNEFEKMTKSEKSLLAGRCKIAVLSRNPKLKVLFNKGIRTEVHTEYEQGQSIESEKI